MKIDFERDEDGNLMPMDPTARKGLTGAAIANFLFCWTTPLWIQLDRVVRWFRYGRKDK